MKINKGLLQIPQVIFLVDRYYARGELPEMLSSCDYIINILPSTKETDNILSK